jgi:hypothetical protein
MRNFVSHPVPGELPGVGVKAEKACYETAENYDETQAIASQQKKQ